ncbi:MAG: helix-turn-helix domain-containing protein [Candidatus Latescibacteria bacterium]|nr:helix-turn-helix domain-containing protein [Candidatus Latescibacterota bacterium]
MKTQSLFEYPCPECGIGKVHTTRVRNYKTKIKGYPFIVDEALIGVCDHRGVEQFAPEETRRWEEQFFRVLEARHAFLSPQEITALRNTLGLSMEDFGRLIGCTRQSISAWEKVDRAASPSWMADLLMKLVRQSLHAGMVDVLRMLLDEAKQWGVVIEIRSRAISPEEREDVALRTKRVRREVPS